ncbi:MAG: hypothetical protein INH43_17545 [Acidobacteriaceae bacterium]|nr:hypothetical protein [Acidobacteriaceae bacterium]
MNFGKSFGFLSLIALAIFGLISAFDAYQNKSNHFGEPIIIDNGPTKIQALPPGHRSNLVDGRDGGKTWLVVDKQKFTFLKVLPKGTQCGEGTAVCKELATADLTIEFSDKKVDPAGKLAVKWTGIGNTGVVHLESEQGTSLSWNRSGWPLYLGAARLVSPRQEEYRIDKVNYEGKPIWSQPPQRTDVMVYVCANPAKCEHSARN